MSNLAVFVIGQTILNLFFVACLFSIGKSRFRRFIVLKELIKKINRRKRDLPIEKRQATKKRFKIV